MAVTGECVRVLKPTGSLWVNLGDRYSGHRAGGSTRQAASGNHHGQTRVSDGHDPAGHRVPAKSLLGIPWRYALRCLDELGLILRAEVIWAKPNGLPESVTDRVRRSHETWFHFTLGPRYYAAVDLLREPHAAASHRRVAAHRAPPSRAMRAGLPYGDVMAAHTLARERMLHPAGKLPGSVWTIPTQPLRIPAELRVEHFAAFPLAWPARIIAGWSPHEVCTRCGQGRRPVAAGVALDLARPQARRAQELAQAAGLTEAHLAALLAVGVSDTGRGKATQSGTGHNTPQVYALAAQARQVLGGYAREYLLRRPTGFTDTCGCPDTTAPTRPGVVLDPFGGTGTTALAASVLGRRAITVDASHDYCRLASWRVHDSRQRARAADTAPAPIRTDKPSPCTEHPMRTAA